MPGYGQKNPDAPDQLTFTSAAPSASHSNKAVKDWPEMLAGDEVISAGILNRLLHASHVLNIRGRSYRLKELEASLHSRS